MMRTTTTTLAQLLLAVVLVLVLGAANPCFAQQQPTASPTSSAPTISPTTANVTYIEDLDFVLHLVPLAATLGGLLVVLVWTAVVWRSYAVNKIQGEPKVENDSRVCLYGKTGMGKLRRAPVVVCVLSAVLALTAWTVYWSALVYLCALHVSLVAYQVYRAARMGPGFIQTNVFKDPDAARARFIVHSFVIFVNMVVACFQLRVDLTAFSDCTMYRPDTEERSTCSVFAWIYFVYSLVAIVCMICLAATLADLSDAIDKTVTWIDEDDRIASPIVVRKSLLAVAPRVSRLRAAPSPPSSNVNRSDVVVAPASASG